MENYNERRVRYYEVVAREYDRGWGGGWLADEGERAAFGREVETLGGKLSSLPSGRVLDVACGTGVLTRCLRGEVVGLDGSEEMLRIARERVPSAAFVRGDALSLPFPERSFDRVFASNFYGLLLPGERPAFLGGARRVAPELILAEVKERDAGCLGGKRETGWQARTLADGSEHLIYRRYFTAEALTAELGGEVLFDGSFLVAARRI